jgi:hypothetical protein
MLNRETPPRVTPDHHRRQAAHLRALAIVSTTRTLKERLLREAEEHEQLAGARVSPTEARGDDVDICEPSGNDTSCGAVNP